MSAYFSGKHVVVTGAGVSGRGCARLLAQLGAEVTVVDANPQALDIVSSAGDGVHTMCADAALAALHKHSLVPALVVTSPGWRPDSPLLTEFRDQGIEVIGDVELAWRLDQQEVFGPTRRWLAITGTNGKTTTTGMLAAIMQADGQVTHRRAEAAGNIGRSVFELLADRQRVDDVVVELSSFQLHWSQTIQPAVGVLLNLSGDHLDWHGSFSAYAAAKAKVLRGNVAVIGRDDERVRAIVADGATAPDESTPVVAFTLNVPEPGEVGVRDAWLVDNQVQPTVGFSTAGSLPCELAPVEGIEPPGAAGLADAAAAATAARSVGALPESIRTGLAAYRVDGHRGALVANVNGIAYVDNSKATNPHAADAALSGVEHVVWIAGGQLKGAVVRDVIAKHRSRLRAVVILGADRANIAAAVSELAPGVPVEDIAETHPQRAMDAVVAAARRHAEAGDTVLLAPAAASLDMYSGMAQRGDAFAAAVRSQTSGKDPSDTSATGESHS